MNIIFLDVDGVLNDFYTLEKNRQRNIFEESGPDLDENKFKLLKELVDKTNSKIVLSSSWRVFFDEDSLKPLNYSAQEFMRLFYKYGLHLYSVTGRSKTHKREDEINDWLNNHDNIEAFAILDDDDDDLTSFIGTNLVKTKYYDDNRAECGLTRNHVEESIKILMKKSKVL